MMVIAEKVEKGVKEHKVFHSLQTREPCCCACSLLCADSKGGCRVCAFSVLVHGERVTRHAPKKGDREMELLCYLLGTVYYTVALTLLIYDRYKQRQKEGGD